MTKTTIVLVGCASQKLDRPAPARDLYVSDLFRKASAYAEAIAGPDGWLILSAKYGLVFPSNVLEPYDRKLGTKNGPPIHDWARDVADQLLEEIERRGLHHADVELVVLAGAQYATILRYLGDVLAAGAVQPLEGLGVGQRKSWLKAQLEDLGAPAYVTAGAAKAPAPAPALRPLSHYPSVAGDEALCGLRRVPGGAELWPFASHIDGTGCDECVRIFYAEQVPAPAPDPKATAVDALGKHAGALAELEAKTLELVLEARTAGASWSTVGAALGVTKQAAAQKYGKLEWARTRDELRAEIRGA